MSGRDGKKINKILSMFLALTILLLMLPDGFSMRRSEASSLEPDVTAIPDEPEVEEVTIDLGVEAEPMVEPVNNLEMVIEADPTEEPTAEPTPEPTAVPTPEPTEEPTPEPTALLFQEGYVRIERGETIYEDAELKKETGVLAQAGYAYARVEKRADEPVRDVLRVMFDADDQGTEVQGFVRFDKVAVLDDEAQAVLVETLINTTGARRANNVWKPITAFTFAVTEEPTQVPTEEPTEEPTVEPTEAATDEPTVEPTEATTEEPTVEPTEATTDEPTAEPTESTTEEPTVEPTEATTEEPTVEPTEATTEEPTVESTEATTEESTAEPTEAATDEPTVEPTEAATDEPTVEPTEATTEEPTVEPTEAVTEEATVEPTEAATEEPTVEPAEEPMGESTETEIEEPVPADPLIKLRGRTLKDRVNVRAEASTQSAVVGNIAQAGSEFEVREAVEGEGGTWYAIVLDGIEGFIRGDLLEVWEEAAEAESEKTPVAGEQTWRGADYTVKVSYGSDAGFPEGTELAVREILQDTDEYEAYLVQAMAGVDATDAEQVAFLRFFDITFEIDGAEIEPNGPVSVQILFPEPEQGADDVNVLHITDEGVNQLDDIDAILSGDALEAVRFEADGFSVFGVMGVMRAAAAATKYSGECGSCTWTIDADGLLTIRPTNGTSGQLALVIGETASGNTKDTHWNQYRTEIKKVKFENGVKAWTNSRTLFDGCTNLEEVDFGNFDTSAATSMYAMFKSCPNLKKLDLSGFNTSNVTSFQTMFCNCNALEDLKLPANFVTSKATTMIYMFSGCSSLTSINTSGWNTSNVTSMRETFYNCSGLTSLDLSGFNTAKVNTMRSMFNGCSSLESVILSANFKTDLVTDVAYMFQNCYALETVGASNGATLTWNLPVATEAQYMFNNCYNLRSLEKLKLTGGGSVTNMAYMFNGCSSLTKAPDLSALSTASVTNMSNMLDGCSRLTALNVSSFTTANVTNMAYMFNNCGGLTSLNLSNFNTQKVANMAYMFNNCSNLTSLDVSSFNTINAANMSFMFSNCHKLPKLDLGNFDMQAVSNVTYFLHGNEALKEITVGSNFKFTGGTTSFTFPDYGSIDVWKNTTTNAKYTAEALAETYNSGYAATYVFDDEGRATQEITIKLEKYDKEGNSASRTGAVKLTLDDAAGNDVTLYWDAANNRYTMEGTAGGSIEMTFPVNAEEIRMLLPIGSYTLHQEDADSGYQKAGDYPFELGAYVLNDQPSYGLLNESKGEDGAYPTTITRINTELVGRVEVRKVDFSEINQGNLKLIFLQGAEFRLWNDEENFTGTTDTNGKLVFDGLSLTQYQLQETKAPVGYKLKNPNPVYTIDFTNPDSGETDGTSSAPGVTITNSETEQATRQKVVQGNAVVATLAVSAQRVAGTVKYSGVCGGCSWVIDEDGLLTIYPTDGVSGQLAQVTASNQWNQYKAEIKEVVFEDGVKAAANSSNMFNGCANLTKITFGDFDTSTATNMQQMFDACSALESVDVSGFNTANVTNMQSMFRSCNKLQVLDVSNFATAKVTTMGAMFEGTDVAQLDVSGFDTSKVTNMSYMFYNCARLSSVDVSGFNTAKVTTMHSMFRNCPELTSLAVENWDTGKVTTMQAMFQNCGALTSLNIRNWNTGNVTIITDMFNGCATLRELDLSGWDLGKLNGATRTFAYMSNLETLKLNNITTGALTGYDMLMQYNYNLQRLEVINSAIYMSSGGALATAFPDGTWKYQPMLAGSTTEVEADGEIYNVNQILSQLMRKTVYGSAIGWLPAGVYTRQAIQSPGLENKPATNYIIDNLSSPVILEQSSLLESYSSGTAFALKVTNAAQTNPVVGGTVLKIKFKDAAIDINGERHDVVITLGNVRLLDESGRDTVNLTVPYYVNGLFTYNTTANTFGINNNRGKTLGGTTYTSAPIQVDVKMEIDGAREGTFLFYATDIDVANKAGRFEENAEGVIFGEGFHLDTLNRADETITQWAYHYRVGNTNTYVSPYDAEQLVGSTHSFVNGDVVPNGSGVTYYREYYTDDGTATGTPNWLIGTASDAGTNLSGFFAAGDAAGANFTWTAGVGCGTTFMGGGGVTVVKIEKKDQDDEGLAGARLQLHDERGNLLGEWDSEANNSRNFILNSGLYRLSEVSAPGGRQLAEDIWFRVNPDGTIAVSMNGKDGNYQTQTNADGSATAALEMINQFFTIERIVDNDRIAGDIEIIKKDEETGKPMQGVSFSLQGVPEISGKYQYVSGVENPGDTDVTSYYFPKGSNIGFPRDAAGNFLNYSTYKLTTNESGTTGADGKVKFEKIPQGVYVLTETTPEHYQALADRYWVEIDENGTATLYKQAGAGTTTVTINEDQQLELPSGATAVSDKTITNKRVRHDLTVGKTVSGNMGSKAKYFKVTIQLNDGTYAMSTGTNTYAIDLTNADASADGHSNPTSITLTNGSGSADVWLRHGQTVTVKDLPYGVKFTVSEDSDSYTAKYSLNNGGQQSGANAGEQMLDKDSSVAFANELIETIPTGIVDSIAPALWGGMIAILLLGLVFASRKRRFAR